MSKLYDRYISTLSEKAIKELGKPIIIDINNIANYFYENYPLTKKESEQMLAVLSMTAPPFPNFFMESKKARDPIHSWGIKFNFWHLDEAREIAIDKYGKDKINNVERSLADYKKDNIKWLGSALLIWEIEKNRFAKPFCWGLAIKKDGKLARCGLLEDMNYLKIAKVEKKKELFSGYIFPALLAIAFMHCKNVTTEEIIPPEKLSKKFKKKHGRELIRYYVLKIEPMRKILKTEGKSDKMGIIKALHICRGHFKDYRQSGLFGKVPGIFWWESHVRGKKEKGIILKDYEIGKPKADYKE